MPTLIGSRLGPYEIVAPLGAGGMGEVYRARDTKLDRDVAIKLLPDSVAAEPEALARFEREAKAVAALSHPNILSIFDFGAHNGIAYAVMELLEGQTLRARLDAGPIPETQALEYALQFAKGLAAAHEKGIVHRDLKPENLFISTDGHLKILDFGLAKRTLPVDEAEITRAATISRQLAPGTARGTLSYMSPEQVRAQPVDHRSDIFSFGCILYELLSGRKAFKRDTVPDTMAAIIMEDPPELSAGRGMSPALIRTVKHCLEKRPEDRFQTVRDIVFTLTDLPAKARSQRGRRIAAAAVVLGAIALSFPLWRGLLSPAPKPVIPGGKQPRLVVLPFENLGAPEDAYFAAGITEEIINRLAHLQGLAVISRTTAIGYDRKGKSIRQIGEDLGVDFVLEGTVRWDRRSDASRLRISPELIKVVDDTHLWSDQYDRVMADVFGIQSEVAENVVRSLGMTLVPRERTALVTASTHDMQAYDSYLRGLQLAGLSHGQADQAAAVHLFQSAVDKDPRFPQAFAELAKAHLSLYFYFDRFKAPPDKSHVESARKVLESLTVIGEDLPETLIARGYYTYWGLDRLEPALVDFKAALVLQPSSIPALSGELFVLRRQGKFKEAGDVVHKLFELDPQNTEILQQAGMTFVALRGYDEADRYYSLATKFNRNYGIAWGQQILLQTYAGDARKAEALGEEAKRVPGLIDEFGWVDYGAVRAALLMRDYPEALRRVDAMKRDVVDTQWFYIPTELLRAELHEFSHQPDQARQWFEATRKRMEALVMKSPRDSRFHSTLAIAYAGLGRRTEAVQEADKGVELMPAVTDAWRVMWRRQDVARVHTMLGDQSAAIADLDGLLSGWTELSAQVIHLDPRWDSLRSNAQFTALLKKYGSS